MKALKSELAKKLLADPRVRERLQGGESAGDDRQVVVEFRDGDKAKQYVVRVVAKAA
ncbi:hypothetical protein [Pelomonas cellulosilytica]|uniref:Uncharacterized protein n=1 Tax=Pelomonas cellulosilytica TaxID=2906762 RepID=A0ABS8XRF5_9BURK|nr:hypothetical protein [Pelomonas sp. P8]MCE4555302.1 hypothetical protein [Pelomonas sp. P8]